MPVTSRRPAGRSLVSIVTLGLLAPLLLRAADAAGPATQPTSQPTTQPAAAGGLIDRAMAAFDGGDFGGAADLAHQRQVELGKAKTRPDDPAMVNAVDVEGVALMRQGQLKKAGDVLQRVAKPMAGNRAWIVNLAICDMSDKELVVRAIKNLSGYAMGHAQDEEVVNLLGGAIDALEQAGRTAKAGELWKAYEKVNAQLEATRQGQRRWGSDWLAPAAYDSIANKRRAQQRVVDSIQGEVKYAASQYDAAARRFQAAKGVLPHGPSDHQYAGDNCVHCQRARAAAAASAAADEMAHWKPIVENAQLRLAHAVGDLPKPRWVYRTEPLPPALLP